MDIRSRYFLGYAMGQVESVDLVHLAFKHAAENAHAIPNRYVQLDKGERVGPPARSNPWH